ncbi:hypothetical protein BDZ89DRAFT_1129848 [Hymenopellis radicata]|nr:hypothetical protein BDZ89DRAFT_1129848 [Hymenopellis radicata]
MAKTTPFKTVDSVDLLELAQRLRDIQLHPQEAGLLIDLIGIATTRFERVKCGTCVYGFANEQVFLCWGTSSSDSFLAVAGAANAPAGSAAVSQSASSVVTTTPASATQGYMTTPVATPTHAALPQATTPSIPAAGPPPTSSPASAAPAVASSAASPAPAVASSPAVITPTLPASNNGHPYFQVLPATFNFISPAPGTPGPYYVITRGRVVGIVAGWDRASPNCIGVGGAVFRSVPSVDAGKQLVQSALAAGACMLLP